MTLINCTLAEVLPLFERHHIPGKVWKSGAQAFTITKVQP